MHLNKHALPTPDFHRLYLGQYSVSLYETSGLEAHVIYVVNAIEMGQVRLRVHYPIYKNKVSLVLFSLLEIHPYTTTDSGSNGN